MATNNSVNTGLSGFTGTGNFVGSTSPTLVTPALGTPASGVLTNCTGIPASAITGQVSLADGGTNANLTASLGSFVYSTGSALAIGPAPSFSGQLYYSQSGAAPIWSAAVYPFGTTANQLLYSVTGNNITGLATANSSVLVTDPSGVPSLSTTLPNIALGTPTSGTLSNCTILGRLINIQVFKSGGTYTPTSGMTHCVIQCVGGGGAGGGTPSAAAGKSATGGGGGSGGFSQSYVTSGTIGGSQTVTIGAGGTGSSNANGNPGADTSVGSIVIGKGGSGGSVTTISAFITAGAAGGVAGTGDITVPGNPGAWCLNFSDVNCASGAGGSSCFGGSAPPVVTVTAAGNSASANSGSGGSGSVSLNGGGAEAGGAGGSGIVIIYEYS